MKRHCFVLLLAAGTAHAEDTFTLSDLNVSPTLTAMVGGDFTAETTMVGEGTLRAAGGDFTLEAAVIPLPITVVPGDVTMFIAVEGDNVVLTWPASGDGCVLESVAALSNGHDWQPVQPAPKERRHVMSRAQPAVFFRLRRP